MDLERAVRLDAVIAARRYIHRNDRETIDRMLAIVRIPAPPFGEAERGQWTAHAFKHIGLADVSIDEAGNVYGRIGRDTRDRGAVILSAHLDTVFPAETPLDVRRNGTRIHAPGIADNARGVAAMITVAEALMRYPVETEHPIVFIASVGEEGIGDLRGVKHIFRPGSAWRDAAAFISLDGTGRRRIVNRAIGSRRFHVRITGPGGHSWADWGIANPVHALGSMIGRLNQVAVPRSPRTSLTVGRLSGGTSVNAIPADAWMEIDLRSETAATLADIEAQLRDAVRASMDEANARRRRGTPALNCEIRVIGDRPTGETSPNHPLVRAARAATRLTGDQSELVASSTDANIPIALGIPAIAMGAGGDSGGAHTIDEWYSNDGGPEGIERVLLTVLGAAGVGE